MSEKIDKAIKFATDCHSGQVRKLTKIPYIFHPVEVAQIICSMTDNEDVVCAALLHDTVEDTKASFEQIEEMFGPRVRELVAWETEDKRPDRSKAETWMIRKKESLSKLEECEDTEAKMIWLGDKLSNVRSLYRSKLMEGEHMWDSFHNKNPKDHEWYYRTIAKDLEALSDYSVYREFVAIVNALFED